MDKSRKALRMSLISVNTAIVAVFTIAIRIPTPLGGYVSLSDASVTFVCSAFGPFTGFIASSLGTALADTLGGFASWAPISFTVHGLEALAVSLIIRKDPESLLYKAVAAISAVIIVSGGYYLLAGLFLVGFNAALAELALNAVQAGLGVPAGLALSSAVRASYRKIDELAW